MRASCWRFASDRDFLAIRAVPRRYAMAPPKLARDAPVADIVHPIKERIVPVLRDETDAAIVHCIQHLRGERLGADEPLRGQEGLDDRLAAMALGDAHRVGFDFFDQAKLVEIPNDPFARFETV